jgi:aminopeptidase N
MDDAAQAPDAAADPGAGQARFDFAQFRRWYHQAGTPRLEIERHWDGEAGSLRLTVRQHTPPTPGQADKQPLVIPLVLGLVGQAGQPLAVHLAGETAPQAAAGQLDAIKLLLHVLGVDVADADDAVLAGHAGLGMHRGDAAATNDDVIQRLARRDEAATKHVTRNNREAKGGDGSLTQE